MTGVDCTGLFRTAPCSQPGSHACDPRKDYREISWGAAAIFCYLRVPFWVPQGLRGTFKVSLCSGKMEAGFPSEFGTAELRENSTETISLPPLQLAPRTGLAQAGCPSAVCRVARTVGGGYRTLGRQGLVNFLHEASLSLQLNKQTRKIRTNV